MTRWCRSRLSDIETVRAHRNQLCDWLEVPRPQLVTKVSSSCLNRYTRRKCCYVSHQVVGMKVTQFVVSLLQKSAKAS